MAIDPVDSQSTNPTNIALLDVIKLIRNSTRQEYDSRLSQFITFLNPEVRPAFENIIDSPYTNEELGSILISLQKQILVNTLEIESLHRLLAKLIFEINEQGIRIESEDLINELNYIDNGNKW